MKAGYPGNTDEILGFIADDCVRLEMRVIDGNSAGALNATVDLCRHLHWLYGRADQSHFRGFYDFDKFERMLAGFHSMASLRLQLVRTVCRLQAVGKLAMAVNFPNVAARGHIDHVTMIAEAHGEPAAHDHYATREEALNSGLVEGLRRRVKQVLAQGAGLDPAPTGMRMHPRRKIEILYFVLSREVGIARRMELSPAEMLSLRALVDDFEFCGGDRREVARFRDMVSAVGLLRDDLDIIETAEAALPLAMAR